jgi:hypothetical protein
MMQFCIVIKTTNSSKKLNMKNLKTIALIAIVILAVSCKKDKQNQNCIINCIYGKNDSTILSYNTNGQPQNHTYYVGSSRNFHINFNYLYTANNCNIQVTSIVRSFSINYQLDTYGNIIACADSLLNGGNLYKSILTCRYNAQQQIIFSEIKHYENGIFRNATKDSFAYTNGNLTRKYHYKKTSGLYYQDGYTNLEYSEQPNQNDFHVTERYLIYDKIISNHFGGGMPNTMSGLLGKGSKNMLIKITDFDNFGTITTTTTLDNQLNAEGKLFQQSYVQSYTDYSGDSDIVHYTYRCN